MPSAPPDPPSRPALVDELARMGFRPVGPAQDDSQLPTGPPPQPRQPIEAVSTEAVPLDAQPNGAQPNGVAPGLGAGSAAVLPPPPAAVPSAAASAPVQPEPTAAPTPPATAAPPTAATPGAARGELTADRVLKHAAPPPSGGWRKAVHTSSFGLINPRPSAAERRDAELIARANRPVPGCWRVAVLSLKGGVGKTTTTAALGVQLATLRGDRVIAVDANPDRGTLAEKVPQVNPATVRDLLRERSSITRYSDVRAFTSLSPSRLEVLASDSDPTASQAFSDVDYRATIGVLEHFYSVILTDCGTGLLHSAMGGVLGLADALVLVTSPSLDGARSASATLDWLEAHGRGELVRQSVAVVSSVRPSGGIVDVQAVEDHFAQRCRAVVRVPFDRHLEAGATVELEQMDKATRHAYLRLAAAVGDGLPGADPT